MNDIDCDDRSDFILWGAAAIAEVINRTPRQVLHLLENRQLPARKIGGRWCASRTALREQPRDSCARRRAADPAAAPPRADVRHRGLTRRGLTRRSSVGAIATPGDADVDRRRRSPRSDRRALPVLERRSGELDARDAGRARQRNRCHPRRRISLPRCRPAGFLERGRHPPRRSAGLRRRYSDRDVRPQLGMFAELWPWAVERAPVARIRERRWTPPRPCPVPRVVRPYGPASVHRSEVQRLTVLDCRSRRGPARR
jgi:hypothetical protein